MDTWEIGVIIILVVVLGIAIYSFIMSRRYHGNISSNVMTKGMSGLSGTKVNLQCPAGQVISFKAGNPTSTRGSLVCLGDPKCDAFHQQAGQDTTFFNPATTIDVFDKTISKFTDIMECENQEQCTWKIPSSSDSRIPVASCLSKCSNLAFIGTYDCVAKS
jgi:hypothetical protein